MVEKRRVLKKGKFVTTRKGSFVLGLAHKIVTWLRPYSKKIEIVGSIRRNEKNPIDIDIVLIPKNKEKLEEFMRKKLRINSGLVRRGRQTKGRFIQGGEKKSRWKVNGVKVELYYTTSESWGATLLAYSSKFGAGIGLRVVARKKGFKLNQYGLFKGGKKVAGRTEHEIYNALGRPYKKPEDR